MSPIGILLTGVFCCLLLHSKGNADTFQFIAEGEGREKDVTNLWNKLQKTYSESESEFNSWKLFNLLRSRNHKNVQDADVFLKSSGGLSVRQPLAFASYYGDHMVLQRAPLSAGVWGYADPSLVGKVVNVTMTTPEGKLVDEVMSIVVKRTAKQATWYFQLRPNTGGPYNITVRVGAEKISISDIVFGDVWICSGQSNMQFSVSQLRPDDLAAELEIAKSYPDVRLFTVQETLAKKPQIDLIAVEQNWTRASAASINGGNWKHFSAVCWLYGRRLHESLGYPIGLVASSYGGSPIKSWSSPDALQKCPKEDILIEVVTLSGEKVNFTNSILWNAMIHPLLNMTIYGTIWYQGEADEHSHIYSCAFPAMINDWRQKFHLGTLGQTNKVFPFGFVQLAADHNDSSIIGGFPSVRWQQTANIGYVPNAVMQNVFMAVAMDLPDFSSPFEGIHPRDKETVADRLHLAGMSVAYAAHGLTFQGPWPLYFEHRQEANAIYVSYENQEKLLRVLSTKGFEVCCQKNTSSCPELSPAWTEAPIILHDFLSVTLSLSDKCRDLPVRGVRYAWRESPCLYKRCAVYGAENFLPGAPFVMFFSGPLQGSQKLLPLF